MRARTRCVTPVVYIIFTKTRAASTPHVQEPSAWAQPLRSEDLCHSSPEASKPAEVVARAGAV